MQQLCRRLPADALRRRIRSHLYNHRHLLRAPGRDQYKRQNIFSEPRYKSGGLRLPFQPAFSPNWNTLSFPFRVILNHLSKPISQVAFT